MMNPIKYFLFLLLSSLAGSVFGKEKDLVEKEIQCLALNIYFEARGEGVSGQFAVAAVTMNRTASKKYPDTICEVVWQPYQFSWTNDGKSDRPKDMNAWKDAVFIAKLVYKRYFDIQKATQGAWDLTHGALHYYAPAQVSPDWAKSANPVATIGRHVFVAYAS